MKHLLISLWLFTAIAFSGAVQTGLNIDKIFGGKYVSDPQVSETLMSGNHRYLRENSLTTLATFKGPAPSYVPTITPLVLADAHRATGRNVRYEHGKLYFAFLVLPQVEVKGVKYNRYLYYLDTSINRGKNVVVVYLEGDISQDDAAELISAMTGSNN